MPSDMQAYMNCGPTFLGIGLIRCGSTWLYKVLKCQPLHYGKRGLKNPAIMTVGDVQLDWLPFVLPNGNKSF